MKLNLEIKEFDKETLSCLFETASFCNYSAFDYDMTNEAKEIAEGEYYNERAADALLKGKVIIIYDNTCHEEDYKENDDLPFYGVQGTNWVRKFKHQFEYDGIDGKMHTCYVPGYEVTIDTLIKGFNASTDPYKSELVKYFTECEEGFEGDMFAAYNFFQIAVFGEIIYA